MEQIEWVLVPKNATHEMIGAAEKAWTYEEVYSEMLAASPLPCPFCGHVGVNVHEGSTYRWAVAECHNCEAKCGEARRSTAGAIDETDREKAIAGWNTRATSDKQDQRTHRALLARCLSVIETLEGEDSTESEMLAELKDEIRQAIGLKPEVQGSLL